MGATKITPINDVAVPASSRRPSRAKCKSSTRAEVYHQTLFSVLRCRWMSSIGEKGGDAGESKRKNRDDPGSAQSWVQFDLSSDNGDRRVLYRHSGSACSRGCPGALLRRAGRLVVAAVSSSHKFICDSIGTLTPASPPLAHSDGRGASGSSHRSDEDGETRVCRCGQRKRHSPLGRHYNTSKLPIVA